MAAQGKILILDSKKDRAAIKALSSEVRMRILDLLVGGERNVNEIALSLDLPQSTVATNIATLEATGLIKTVTVKAKKGSQKICYALYGELAIRFEAPQKQKERDFIEVAMPLGLFTAYEVSAPCGLCSTESIIGFLDVTGSFLSPDRMKAALLWFGQGWVEYKFPNNALYKDKAVKRLELSAELSSETPGTNPNWPSDISLWVNGVEIGTWTSPGDFGDQRGKLTPMWWKLEGSQYGLLKNWIVTESGSFIDGVRISGIRLADLEISKHHAIRVRLGIKEKAAHRGGLNIFGRGFGNYDQDIVLRLGFD